MNHSRIMARSYFGIGAVLAALVLGLATGCSKKETSGDGAGSDAGLVAAVAEFPRQVIEVTGGVHVAVGFGLANSIMIEGSDGVVIVDAMESAEAARPVREAFRKISDKPVRAIVLTHNHADHIFGAGVLAGSDHPEVIAHATFARELEKLAGPLQPVLFKRSMRQFGTALPSPERLNCGIGPRLLTDANSVLAPLLPTRTFDGEQTEIDVAGVHMVLVHAPGETPDQIFVWLPDKRVLLAGDNFYHSFPNLYTIRGGTYRDVLEWIASLDKMRALRPAFLVPGHTLPISGTDEIARTLTDYRDAIQYVHDRTVTLMNDGLSAEDIAAQVQLPASLAERPYLAEHYGRIDWSVRAIFDGYVGWFSGNAADLPTMSSQKVARRMATLAGGSEKLRDAARAALEQGDARWALELADQLRALGEFTDVAAQVRAASLRMMATTESSANGRNYYMSEALEAEGKIKIEPPDPAKAPIELLRAIPIETFMRSLCTHLRPDKARGRTMAVGFRFPDLGQEWGVWVRNSVAELQPRLPERADMMVTVDSQVWKEILARKRNATAAFVRGDVKVDRNRLELVRFLLLFR
ncbi:MAG: MBL fold metallo-hydrolase [Deltaproteobacteria bacterium]|nr:MBL fold metallo-hydrolase [Deltaproteobacteria bacterium]